MKLSPTQQDLLNKMGDSPLQRWPGGFWTLPGVEVKYTLPNGVKVPKWHFGTRTIYALIDKGALVSSKTEKFHDGTLMPIEVVKSSNQ